MKNLTFSEEEIKQIHELSFSSISDSRGKARQNKINEVVIGALKRNPEYDGCVHISPFQF